MALSKENITQLVRLQKKDAALDRFRTEIDKIPVAIEGLRGSLEAEKNTLSEVKNKIISLEKNKKEKEMDLAQQEESAKKHSLELNQVKTNEAFKALQNEIDLAKSQGSDLETDILGSMEEIDACRKEEKRLKIELQSLEEKTKSEVGVLEARLKELQTQFDAASAERNESAAPIPKDAMRIYDHIRKRGKNDAVVAIQDSICSGCRITLSPQIIVDATRATSLVTCESCQRILYKAEIPAAKPA